MTADLVGQLKEHKAEVLALVADTDASVDTIFVSHVEYSDDIANENGLQGDADVFDDTVDLCDNDTIDLSPCESCGGLDMWESLAGNWRCINCDPPTKAIKTLGKAEKLRKRYGLPDPIGAA